MGKMFSILDMAPDGNWATEVFDVLIVKDFFFTIPKKLGLIDGTKTMGKKKGRRARRGRLHARERERERQEINVQTRKEKRQQRTERGKQAESKREKAGHGLERVTNTPAI